jgi:1-acyl-sn-glycerol-3-phosphate acyltransferase
MLKSLPNLLLGTFSLLALTVNTVFWCSLLYISALLKLCSSKPSWRAVWARVSHGIAGNWTACNNLGLRLTKEITWDVVGLDGLEPEKWYLLISNHQSMVDIVVLQKIFHRKIPVLKFFIKKELIWVPFLGAAWWALDFPFMKRTGSAHRDMKTARKACEKFKLIPVTVMNFVEGTRFTAAKRKEQESPYTHLLKPKTGGIGIVLGAMGDQLHSILDVTIVYPSGAPGIWEFLCARNMEVKVRVRQIPISSELLGDYSGDKKCRLGFNQWLNSVWKEKDELLHATMEAQPGTARDVLA